jgi:hypothetical protein
MLHAGVQNRFNRARVPHAPRVLHVRRARHQLPQHAARHLGHARALPVRPQRGERRVMPPHRHHARAPAVPARRERRERPARTLLHGRILGVQLRRPARAVSPRGRARECARECPEPRARGASGALKAPFAPCERRANGPSGWLRRAGGRSGRGPREGGALPAARGRPRRRRRAGRARRPAPPRHPSRRRARARGTLSPGERERER